MSPGRMFVSHYNEIIQWLLARKVSFDVLFVKGEYPDFNSLIGVLITPHWIENSSLHDIYKKQFEEFHYARG